MPLPRLRSRWAIRPKRQSRKTRHLGRGRKSGYRFPASLYPARKSDLISNIWNGYFFSHVPMAQYLTVTSWLNLTSMSSSWTILLKISVKPPWPELMLTTKTSLPTTPRAYGLGHDREWEKDKACTLVSCLTTYLGVIHISAWRAPRLVTRLWAFKDHHYHRRSFIQTCCTNLTHILEQQGQSQTCSQAWSRCCLRESHWRSPGKKKKNNKLLQILCNLPRVWESQT